MDREHVLASTSGLNSPCGTSAAEGDVSMGYGFPYLCSE